MSSRPVQSQDLESVVSSTLPSGISSDAHRGPVLPTLIAALHASKLNDHGEEFAFKELVRCLVNDALIPHLPRDRVGSAVIAIASLPRTASTLLHNLLALDPDARYLSAAEALNPGFAMRGLSSKELGIATRMRIAAITQVMPTVLAQHPMTVHGPEECCIAEMSVLAGHQFQVQFGAAELSPPFCEDGARYEFLSRLLETLEPTGLRRWVLKSPTHVGHEALLLHTFPGSRVVEIVRPYEAVMSSWTRLVRDTRRPFLGDVDPDQIRSEWGRVWRERSEAQQAFGKARPGSLLSVDYDRLVGDPRRTVYDLYEQLGLDRSARYEARLSRWLAANPLRR